MDDQIRLRSKLTIFDGPDGGGKTTAIGEFLQRNPDTLYIHHHNYKNIHDDLARLYLDSIAPAVVGGRDVVLDRCWLDEEIYGAAFRGGANRLGSVACRHIERLALTCATSLVICLPPWENVEASFKRRHQQEYLQTFEQLQDVYGQFTRVKTALPNVVFDYTRLTYDQLFHRVEDLRTLPHLTTLVSGGRINSKVLLVTDPLPELIDHSPFISAPAAPVYGNMESSLRNTLFTMMLDDAGVSESDIGWVTSDSLTPLELEWLRSIPTVVALTGKADLALLKLGFNSAFKSRPGMECETAALIASRK